MDGLALRKMVIGRYGEMNNLLTFLLFMTFAIIYKQIYDIALTKI